MKSKENTELFLELKDREWPYEYIDHDRETARAVVFDEKGFLYFVRAERNDEFGTAVTIETPGGGVEPGEDLQSALRRELMEELGVKMEVIDSLGTVSDYYNLLHRHNLSHYYLCRALSFGERKPTEAEQKEFHLSAVKLRYEEALREYEAASASRLGRLIAQREVPVLKKAKERLDQISAELD